MSGEIVFLSKRRVLALHKDVLDLHGGEPGILNRSLLESALYSAQASYGGEYLNTFPYEMAAAYLIGFSRNHAFVDGNKRTALAVVTAFLGMNGHAPRLSNADMETLVLHAAVGNASKARVAHALASGVYP